MSKSKKEPLYKRLKDKIALKNIVRQDMAYIKKHQLYKKEADKSENIEKNDSDHKNKDLNEEILTAINIGNKSILRREDNTPDNIWFTLINPERATEIRAWLFNNRLKALILRGPKGETMLHWAVLSEYSLILDLVDAGIDINCKDKNGMTPMDWLVERFWELTYLKTENIPYQGLLKLHAQTEELGLLAYSIGGRPTDFENINTGDMNSAVKMTAGGAFWYIETLYNDKGINFLRNWLDNKRSVIHVWILSTNNGLKYKNLKKMLDWGLSIDEKDIDGRTPLWYLVEAWTLSDKSGKKKMEKIIEHLLDFGADPNSEDNYGVSPRLIMNPENHNYEDIMHIEKILEKNYSY